MYQENRKGAKKGQNPEVKNNNKNWIIKQKEDIKDQWNQKQFLWKV